MNISIERVEDSQKLRLVKKVKPNFVYNRFDIRYGKDFDLYKINDNGKDIYVPIHLDNKTAELGVWLTGMSKQAFNDLKKKVFRDYKTINCLNIKHSLNKVKRSSKAKIHWHINLQTTVDEFNSKLSKHTRRNIKRYPQKITDNFKSSHIKYYSVSEIPEEVMGAFFEYKNATHNVNYNGVTAEDYLNKYYITNGYAFFVEDEIVAVALMSIVDDNIYLENITYNKKFENYSVGTILYYHLIKEAIESGKYDKMFLCIGTSEYKSRFNGVGTPTYSGKVLRFGSYILNVPLKIFIQPIKKIKKRFKKCLSRLSS